MTTAGRNAGEPTWAPALRAEQKGDGGRRMLVRLALLAILIAAGLLRFSGLDREGRWGDEYWQTRSYDLPLTYPHYVVMAAREHGQPPLDYLLGWALAKLARSDWVRRAPAAFFGVAAVALCFLLVRRITSPIEGLVAAALLAVSPLHWVLSQEARPYTICTAFMLLAMWALSRALERPDRRRLLAYAAACYLMVVTRGMLPYVVLLGVGATLTAGLLLGRVKAGAADGGEYRILRRVWLVTALVGLAATPILLFLMNENPFITFTASGRQNGALFGTPFLARLGANATVWADMPASMFGPAGVAMSILAAAGVLLCVKRRHALSLPARCTLTALAIISPLYVLTYSVAVSFHPINDRYGLFVVPIVAIFAAVPVGAGIKGLWQSAPEHSRARWAMATAAVALVLVPPTATTLARTNQYSRPDWRGCAEFLADKIATRDVIIVFQDRPLGRPQMTFWGKYDWPREMDKPLAEPAWTLASSEPHWRRLTEKTGDPYIVIRYNVEPGPKDDYLRHGLTKAPPGMTLTKFRGLDLLSRPRWDEASATDRLITACNDLIAIPKIHPDSNVMLYVLRSRLELLAGESTAAAESLELARQATPARLSKWLDAAVAPHLQTLFETPASSTATLTSTVPFNNEG